MRRLMFVGLVASLILAGVGGYAAGSRHLFAPKDTSAAVACQTFPQTGKTVCDRFLEYWQQNGGLAQQGLPLSDAFQERSAVDGKTYTVQYFERAVFELQPENQRPYDVLLSLLGREKYLAQYPNGPGGSVPPSAQPSAQPSGSLIGQVFDFPAALSDAPMRGEVTDFKENLTLSYAGKQLVPQGRFVAVFIRVTNLSNKVESVSRQSFVMADGRGRQFSMAELDAQFAARDAFNTHIVFTDIQPSLSDLEVFIFDVAPDAANFRMVGAKR